MIHPAARGFERDPSAYDAGRPDYPGEAIAWLADRLRLDRDSVVVDVGAGTGKLSTRLLSVAGSVIAVEPVAEMRAAIERKRGATRVLEGVAESLPLDSASADAVVAGQAFHWFEGPAALSEFHRVLRPGGRLGLIWNRRDLTQPLQRAISELIEPYRGSAPAHRSGHWRRSLENTDLFEPVDEGSIPMAQTLDPDGLVARVASTSFIAALPDSARRSLLDEVRELARNAPVELAYATEAFAFLRTP